jgi:hypothetical protein
MAGCPGKDEPGLLDALEILSGFMLQLSACLPRQAIFAAFPDQRSWSRNAAPLSALRNRAGLSWLQRARPHFLPADCLLLRLHARLVGKKCNEPFPREISNLFC